MQAGDPLEGQGPQVCRGEGSGRAGEAGGPGSVHLACHCWKKVPWDNTGALTHTHTHTHTHCPFTHTHTLTHTHTHTHTHTQFSLSPFLRPLNRVAVV